MLLRDRQGETEREKGRVKERESVCVFLSDRWICADFQLLELITFWSVDSQGEVLLICENGVCAVNV